MKAIYLLKSLLVLTAIMFVWGCGSGGVNTSNSSKTQKTVSLSAASKGIEITLLLPENVTIRANADGIPDEGVITVTGPNAALTNKHSLARYTPASGVNKGKLKIVFMTDSAFQPGEFFTIECDVAPNVKDLTPGDFDYEDLKVFDANGAVVVEGRSATIGF